MVLARSRLNPFLIIAVDRVVGLDLDQTA